MQVAVLPCKACGGRMPWTDQDGVYCGDCCRALPVVDVDVLRLPAPPSALPLVRRWELASVTIGTWFVRLGWSMYPTWTLALIDGRKHKPILHGFDGERPVMGRGGVLVFGPVMFWWTRALVEPLPRGVEVGRG